MRSDFFLLEVTMKLLTRTEAAQELRISVQTVDRLRKTGQLPFLPVCGKIFHAEEDLKEYLESCRVPAQKVGA